MSNLIYIKEGDCETNFQPIVLDMEAVEKAARMYVYDHVPSGIETSWSMIVDAMKQAYIAGVKDFFDECCKPTLIVTDELIE